MIEAIQSKSILILRALPLISWSPPFINEKNQIEITNIRRGSK